jgi:RNA polymerase sigma-70 factor (ECF subfamily)
VSWIRGENGDGPDDRLLVGNFLRKRDEKSFRALYRRHTPVLYHLVLRVLRGNEVDADDVIQTTWIRAMENLGGFRWESGLRRWLIGIAVNCSREIIRKNRRCATADLADVADLHALPRITQSVNRMDIENAIAGLPDGYREVLILHDIEGYTHGEIGELLGIESGTSKSQLSRARRSVRVRLLETGKLKP